MTELKWYMNTSNNNIIFIPHEPIIEIDMDFVYVEERGKYEIRCKVRMDFEKCIYGVPDET
jgi:hypothetical protein